MLKHLCSCCGSELRPPDGIEGQGEHISHGICRPCLDLVMGGRGQPLADYLELLGAPVFAVDGDGRLLGANGRAREVVSKEVEEIRGHLGGEVFGCIHSRLPGGCGQTVHCLSCTIRKAVMNTYESGEASIRVPACMDLDTIVGPRRLRFLISTEKAGDGVLLRIDDAQPDSSPTGT